MSEKRNARATLYKGDSFLDGPPGAFRFWVMTGSEEIRGLNFLCPCGCKAVYGCSFGENGRGWTWNGNRDAPTVTPSLGCYAINEEQVKGPDGYHWHGFLTNGEFVEC